MSKSKVFGMDYRIDTAKDRGVRYGLQMLFYQG